MKKTQYVITYYQQNREEKTIKTYARLLALMIFNVLKLDTNVSSAWCEKINLIDDYVLENVAYF